MEVKRKIRIRVTDEGSSIYARYTVEQYVPPKRVWLLFVQEEHWEEICEVNSEQEAMKRARRLEKYGKSNAIWQNDIDELDLGAALE